MPRDADELLASAHAIIDEAVESIKDFPTKQIAPLLSGGHDSLCAVHVATQHPVFAEWGGQVRHINTGIGAKYTREFVEKVCKDEGWPLVVHKSNFSYERFVMRLGFPGPGGHAWVYAALKDRCISQITKGIKRTLLISGARSQESARRMGNVQKIKYGEPSKGDKGLIRRKNRVWVSPCFDWSKEEQAIYMEEMGLPRNRIKTLVGLSGECFCGAFAQDGEIDLIKQHCPDVYDEIVRLQGVAEASGQKRCKWGPGNKSGQKVLARTGEMCSACDIRAMRQGILFYD